MRTRWLDRPLIIAPAPRAPAKRVRSMGNSGLTGDAMCPGEQKEPAAADDRPDRVLTRSVFRDHRAGPIKLIIHADLDDLKLLIDIERSRLDE